MIYRIKGWRERFESNQSRSRIKGPLEWVRIPTANDSLGYRRIMRLPNGEGASVYGCWIALVRVAARTTERGVLARSGKAGMEPLTPRELEDLTDIPEAIIARAIEILASDRVAWLVDAQCADSAVQCADSDAQCADSAVQCADGAQKSADGAQNVPIMRYRERERERESERESPQNPKSESQALGMDWRKYRPADLPRSLGPTWDQIAKVHGGQVANTALQVARRIYGATVTHGQLSAAYQAAHRAGALEKPAAQWPDPTAKPEKPEKSHDGFVQMTDEESLRILTELAAAGNDMRNNYDD